MDYGTRQTADSSEDQPLPPPPPQPERPADHQPAAEAPETGWQVETDGAANNPPSAEESELDERPEARQPPPEAPASGWQVDMDEAESNPPPAEEADSDRRPERSDTEAGTPEETPGEAYARVSAGRQKRVVDATSEDSVEWTASEYVSHQKSLGWYALVILVDLAIAAIVYFFGRDYVSTGFVIVLGVLFVVTASRPPSVKSYKIDRRGLTIGTRHFKFSQFRSFAQVREGAFASVELRPLKRFMPMLVMYFSPQDEQKIVGMLAARLPEEKHQRDMIDKLLHKIRF